MQKFNVKHLPLEKTIPLLITQEPMSLDECTVCDPRQMGDKLTFFHLKSEYMRKSITFKFAQKLIFQIIIYDEMLLKCKQFAFCFVHTSPIQCSLITNRRLCCRFPSIQKPENLPSERNFKLIPFHHIFISILQCKFVYLHSLTSFLI